MHQHLAKSAQSVQQVLQQKGLSCRVLELPSSTRTALDAATSIGCDISQIVKSLIFRTKDTSRPVLVLTSGPNKVSETQIELYTGEQILKADADFAKKMTGFAIGGIPPIGHKSHIELIYIDQDLLSREEVWAAAGTPNAVFCFKSKDLVNMTKGRVIQVKEER